jgi:hypothetical protein
LRRRHRQFGAELVTMLRQVVVSSDELFTHTTSRATIGAMLLIQSQFNTLANRRPKKAGMFSEGQSHRGKSQNPVAWVAFVEETNRMKPTDRAILAMVSELLGRNESELRGGLDKI